MESRQSRHIQVDTERLYIFAQLNHLLWVVPWLMDADAVFTFFHGWLMRPQVDSKALVVVTVSMVYLLLVVTGNDSDVFLILLPSQSTELTVNELHIVVFVARTIYEGLAVATVAISVLLFTAPWMK